MIGFLRGQVLEAAEGRALILTGATGESGVGYLVTVAQSPGAPDLLPGTKLDLHIHTHVREDALDLYGFRTRQDKELFLTLLSVNGIGPKAAVSILSNATADDLIEAITSGRKEDLTKIPGVGKKLAERVALELGDKLRKMVETGAIRMAAPAAAVDGLAGTRAKGASERAILADARQALVGLGYREGDVTPLLNKLYEEKKASLQRPEDLIRLALQKLG